MKKHRDTAPVRNSLIIELAIFIIWLQGRPERISSLGFLVTAACPDRF